MIKIYNDILHFDPYNRRVQDLLKIAEENRLKEEEELAKRKEDIEAKERLLKCSRELRGAINNFKL